MMIQRFFSLKQIAFSVLLVTGIIGSILFFPVPLSSGHACLVHRLLDAPRPIDRTFSNPHIGRAEQAGFGTTYRPMHTPLFGYYMHYFAMPWWLSLGLIAAGYLGLKSTKKQKR